MYSVTNPARLPIPEKKLAAGMAVQFGTEARFVMEGQFGMEV